MQDELGACLQPFARGASVGVDARLDPEHERVRAEVDKLTGLSGEAPDWKTVEQLGCALLSSRSKDVTVAAFVAGARFELAGWPGLREGCELLAGLVRAFAAQLYPMRPRARANALRWWIDHVTARSALLARIEGAQLAPIKQAVAELQRVASDWLGDDVPSFADLVRALDRALVEVPTVAPPAKPAAPPAAREAPPAPVELTLPSDEAGIARYLRVQGSKLIELARARMEADPRDARAYRWLRAGLWLGWEDAPPVGRNGRTAVSAPLPTPRAELQHARNEQRWADVLAMSESLLVVVPHWLELGFVSAQALRELGPAYARALGVVERETRGLHARIPELSARAFRDGTPYASPETLQWLHAGAAAQPEPSAVSAAAADDSLDGLLLSLQRAPSPRALFVQRCRLAQRFVAGGELERAKFVYRGLLEDVDAFALERWEPALALEVVQPLCALSEGQTPAGVKDAELAGLYARLARLAPWLAPRRNLATSA